MNGAEELARVRREVRDLERALEAREDGLEQLHRDRAALRLRMRQAWRELRHVRLELAAAQERMRLLEGRR